MSKFESAAFKKTSSVGGFNLVNQNNSFSSVFDPKPLDGVDSIRIEKLLVDNFVIGGVTEDQVELDSVQLKKITAEIHAIGKQSIVLMGERVSQASELLKPYKDGAFTLWLESTFGSRKTGYNMLSYYNFYNELPNELRDNFKKMPQKSAYILASRKGSDLEVKTEIVREYNNMSHNELVLLIQEKIPLAKKDNRNQKTSNERLITAIRFNLKKLQMRKDSLSDDDKKALSDLANELSFLSGVVSV